MAVAAPWEDLYNFAMQLTAKFLLIFVHIFLSLQTCTGIFGAHNQANECSAMPSGKHYPVLSKAIRKGSGASQRLLHE
jgi:hypothetical protein